MNISLGTYGNYDEYRSGAGTRLPFAAIHLRPPLFTISCCMLVGGDESAMNRGIKEAEAADSPLLTLPHLAKLQCDTILW
jgi:hypothetical protein